MVVKSSARRGAALFPRKVWQAMQLSALLPASSRPISCGLSPLATRVNSAGGKVSSCLSQMASGSALAAPNFGIRVLRYGRADAPFTTTSRSQSRLSFAPTPVSDGGRRPWSPRFSSWLVKWALRFAGTPPSSSRWWQARQFKRVSESSTFSATLNGAACGTSAARTAVRCESDSEYCGHAPGWADKHPRSARTWSNAARVGPVRGPSTV